MGSLKRLLTSLPYTLGYDRGPRVMSALRKRWVLLRHPRADIRFEGPVYLGPGFSLHIPGSGTFVAGSRVEFRRNFRAEVGDSGRIVIGDDTVFTYDCLIQCSTEIEIGRRCVFGQSTAIFDGNHRFEDPDTPMLEQGYDFRPIRIEDGAVVLTKCTIINGIGERAMIAAHSVVTRPVPAWTVAAGSPAEVKKYFGPAADEANAGAGEPVS